MLVGDVCFFYTGHSVLDLNVYVSSLPGWISGIGLVLSWLGLWVVAVRNQKRATEKKKCDALSARSTNVKSTEFTIIASLVTLQTIASWVFSPFPFTVNVGLITSAVYVIFFWGRLNLARWVAIILSVISVLLAVMHFFQPTPFKVIGDAVMVPIALFLLYWLNTARGRACFRPIVASPA
jgi:hypothetical protein